MNLIKMLKYITLLSIITVQLSFASTYYVDATNGNDNNSGLSPSSAWQSINKVNGFNFASGDIIAFQRGQIFNGYTLLPNTSYLTFTSYGTGNLPVIDAQNTRQYCAQLQDKNHITFRSIEFYNGAVECLDVNTVNYLTIDSCVFDGNYHEAQTVYIGESYYTYIGHSVFKNAAPGAANYPYPHGLYLGGGGYQIVEYNKFINNTGDGIHVNVNVNPNGRVPHPIIRYNWFEGNEENYQDQASDSLEFYNNVIVDNPNVAYALGMSFSQEGAYAQYAVRNSKVYNNTFIMNDSLTGHIGIMIHNAAAIDNLTFKNNIIFFANSTRGNGYFVYQQSGSGTLHFDNNLFFRVGGNQAGFANIQGTAYNSFTAWQSAGYDPHSAWNNPLFTNLTTENYTLQAGSPAINFGTNLGLTLDYNNNPIPSSSPDVGAYEHTSTSTYIQVNIKAFLSGPFENGSMTTFLNAQNLIPLSQPYSSSPWNYSGSEAVTSIPSNIVDWILVELRSGITSNTIISRRAAFIKNDGNIVDLDGTSPLRFDFVSSGSYYLVIRHRNHLAIMSSVPVTLSTSSALYDFTTSQSKAYGINPMFSLGNGLFGMYSGDGDANGGISSIDRNDTWRLENGTIGYFQGDYDLSGGVNSTDLNLCWRIDNGTLTQVP